MIQEDASELEAAAQAASEDEEGCFFYTREAVNPYGANTLFDTLAKNGMSAGARWVGGAPLYLLRPPLFDYLSPTSLSLSRCL